MSQLEITSQTGRKRPTNLELTTFNRPNAAKSAVMNGQRSPKPRRARAAGNPEETDKLIDSKPPMANTEVDDFDVDTRETVNKPFPGVDDGFFNKTHPSNDAEHIPVLTNRAGEDIPPKSDNPVASQPQPPVVMNSNPVQPFPRYPESEFGGLNPDMESIPDVNVYQQKKTLAQGMMDLALFSANANQLRYVLESIGHPYYYPGLVMIAISLILQVMIGVGLIWNARYNVKDMKEICIANKISNLTIIAIFLVTVINVFISAFGTTSVVATGTVAAPFPVSTRGGIFDASNNTDPK